MQIKFLPLCSQSESKKMHTKFNLENKCFLPGFSYSWLEIKESTWGLPSTRINLSLADLQKEQTPTMAYQKRFKKVIENKYKMMETHIYRQLQKRNRSESGSDNWKQHRICITTKTQLHIHSRNTCNTPNSEYKICNKKEELHKIHRIEKLPTSASKLNSNQPKSTKTEAHHSETHRN